MPGWQAAILARVGPRLRGSVGRPAHRRMQLCATFLTGTPMTPSSTRTESDADGAPSGVRTSPADFPNHSREALVAPRSDLVAAGVGNRWRGPARPPLKRITASAGRPTRRMTLAAYEADPSAAGFSREGSSPIPWLEVASIVGTGELGLHLGEALVARGSEHLRFAVLRMAEDLDVDFGTAELRDRDIPRPELAGDLDEEGNTTRFGTPSSVSSATSPVSSTESSGRCQRMVFPLNIGGACPLRLQITSGAAPAPPGSW